MDPARLKRKQEIGKALAFIQSSLAYPEPEHYQDFLTHLVCNLLDEGNILFKDGECEQALRQFTEGLNVACYAAEEAILIPKALLESLYVNRATAFHSMAEYDCGVQDCDQALALCKESHRALYRKALCLKELGRHKEAYNCTTDCLLVTRLDKDVNELAQELAVHLGLKNRKPYISTNMRGVANRKVTTDANKVSDANLGNGSNPLSSLAPVSFPSMPQSPVPSICHQPTVPSVPHRVDIVEDSELMLDDLDSLLDGCTTQQETNETHYIDAALSDPSRTSTHTVPVILPAPTPQLPPVFFNSTISHLNSLDSFSGGGHSTTTTTTAALDILDDITTLQGLDALDDFAGVGAAVPNVGVTSTALETLNGLDSLDDFLDTTPIAAATEEVNTIKTDLDVKNKSLDSLSDIEPVFNVAARCSDVSVFGMKAVDQLDSLDVLDSFCSVKDGPVLPAVIGGTGLNSLSNFSMTGSRTAIAPVSHSPKNNHKKTKAVAASYNILSSTHDFLQACSLCFVQIDQGINLYDHKPDLVHSCKLDILLCRRWQNPHDGWTRVRPIPPCTSFKGPFVLCREMLNSEDFELCKYGENCTFAYNQLEIDVWTEERIGRLDRNLLFETTAVKLDPVNSIIRLLQEYKGTFIFLCQECYDGKPRIISTRCTNKPTACSNLDARHTFDANKCLAFVVRTHNVNYRKIRPLSVLCQMDLCHKAVRYGCQREDNCHYAHSIIELKTWRVQQDTGIRPEAIVKVAMRHQEKQEQNSSKLKSDKLSLGSGSSKQKGGAGGGGGGGGAGGGANKSLNMKLKLACAQCWRDGQISEADKALKYCTAKARHTWSKDRRVLLVCSLERSKWLSVRPLPHAKNFPMHYDMCGQILAKKKCNFIGKCTFAHSQEEREMWTYMKDNKLQDIQQVYDTWLTTSTQNRHADAATLAQPVPEEKFIVMPTDYAEVMSGFHCRLCGRHSNSERQWQQHISTEKHKARVFSCEGEDEALMWSYRFPGKYFELCPKMTGGCPDGVSCDYAHSPEELQEWSERRDFLRQKLAKAREDMLVMPDDFDFGNYNFLLQD